MLRLSSGEAGFSSVDFPTIPYGVFLADPAWTFRNWSKKGERKNPSAHYRTMTIEQICALPVSMIGADNCALFMWVTWPFLLHKSAPIHRVLAAWGFEYSGLAWEWIKFNPATGKLAFGTGYGTRKNVEPCILARRGRPVLKSKSERDIMFGRRREHSRKPDEQYERIERMYDGPYCELFARHQRPGWDAWGAEVDKFVPLPAETIAPAAVARAISPA